jgi:hypothetical protein
VLRELSASGFYCDPATENNIKREAERTYSTELAFCSHNGGSVDRDGEDATDDGEELSR